MWLVTREVLATTAQEAIRAKGRVYSVAEAAKEYQPTPVTKEIGFKEKQQ